VGADGEVRVEYVLGSESGFMIWTHSRSAGLLQDHVLQSAAFPMLMVCPIISLHCRFR